MEAVLEVYARPYDPFYPVVNLDESPKQLLSAVRKGFVDSQGIEYEDYEYKREGTVDMYMLVEALGGRREVLIKDKHDRLNYAQVIAHIAEKMYPDAQCITLVEDNLSAHKLSALYEVFPPTRARAIAQRIEIVRTPKHGSWLNIAEAELSVLERQALRKKFATKQALEEQVKAWYEHRNQKMKKVDWQFKTEEARIKLKKLYPTFKT